VAFSTPEPFSLREESERHEGDGIRRRRRWQRGNNGLMKAAARPGDDVEAAQRCRGTGPQIWSQRCADLVTGVRISRDSGAENQTQKSLTRIDTEAGNRAEDQIKWGGGRMWNEAERDQME
jgi:hypothetical protein